MSTPVWIAGLGPRSATAAAVQRVDGVLRLSGAATVPARFEPARALAEAAERAGIAGDAPPAAVVVHDSLPLRVTAIAPRQETYDHVLRPLAAALGCACAGGGLGAPALRRAGALESHVQHVLEGEPDVLLFWDDGSELARRWWAALDLHLGEARRQPAWTVPGALARAVPTRRAVLLVVEAGGSPSATALPVRRIAWPGGLAAGALALWPALADLWREQRSGAWPIGDVTPRLRAEALLWAARFLAAQDGGPVVVFDLDLGRVGVYAVAGADVRVQHVPLGGDHPPSFATWVRSRLPSLDQEQLAALVERHVRGIAPADGEALDAELVLCAGRQGLLAAPPDARLVVTGALAAHVADPARIGLWLLDAARPQGRGLLCWDDADALALLAALAPARPEVGEALLADACPVLGAYVVADGAAGAPCLTLRQDDGALRELAAPTGGVAYLALGPGERATVDDGAGGAFVATGGPLGVIVEGRPRQREATLRDFAAQVAALRPPRAASGATNE
ncbi:MAG: hypothetical protein HY691_11185 [Chloroflexi bacterium]|nr:hypothetical protein [Chloroflexota bacterium]